MESLKSLDAELYSEIEARATWTGNRTNGIKDGIRNEWYAKFDLESPAKARGMPYTCVVERPELQEIHRRYRTQSGYLRVTYYGCTVFACQGWCIPTMTPPDLHSCRRL